LDQSRASGAALPTADVAARIIREQRRVRCHREAPWATELARAFTRLHTLPPLHFCTGLREQIAHNVEHHRQVGLTTGNNARSRGMDVVVEGTAVRVTEPATLQRLAALRGGW